MTTPVWTAGTLYSPGALVQPASAIAPVASPVVNGGFESGDTAWTKDAGWTIGEFGNGTHFQGTWSAQWDLTGTGRIRATDAFDVQPGQSITASCQVQQGASSSGQAGARVEIGWYTAADALISYSSGNLVDSGSNQNWKQSSVTGVAPPTAAKARIVGYAFRNSGGDELWVDNFTWDLQVTALPAGLVFRATQAVAGYSASTEPAWPVIVGGTVVDNEVTWEGVIASRVVYEASPILVSGGSEPDFPALADATVADNTIVWTAMNARASEAPNSRIVVIAVSKVFIADKDIIKFSATVNPLDHHTANDAGYIPFGLNDYGDTDISAMGLYRSNLVAFNSQGFQMWQVDQDPANMAILDAAPIPCEYHDTVQPVSNDLAFLSSQGVRGVGIAGASTNLQAGFFGKAIDPLVLAAIRAGEVPFALFYPGAGQYWLIFGNEAFVLTMDGKPTDASWSRYEFPEDIDGWAILDGALYLRAGTLVWRVDDTVTLDDAGTDMGGTISFTAGVIPGPGANPAGYMAFDDGTFSPGGTLVSGTLAGYTDFGVFTAEPEFPVRLYVFLRVPTADLRADPQTAYWTAFELAGTPSVPETLAADFDFFSFEDGAFTILQWELDGISDLLDGNSYVATFTPEASGSNTPFEGYMAWQYLDFGVLGLDKTLESVELAVNGEVSISIGWDQRQGQQALATAPYTVSGDTVNGTPIPIGLTAPSMQVRLTFSGDQAWEWFATQVNIV